ncbi:hypothetical protein [Hyphococcus sp.]|uniref:hypothetical protein n=1 Tax=Hyphococcus sp. TaxID=2038636 RepID=UPI0035C6A135
MTASKEYSKAFVAEWEGPPRRRLYLCQDLPLPNDAPPEMISGWTFQFDVQNEDGEWRPGWDTWEETYSEIIMYPPAYAPKDIEWFDVDSGKPVDIYNL